MKNQLQQVFNFNGTQIRTVMIDGVVWFIGNDVAKVLGYSNYRNAVVSHVDDEDKLRTQIEYAGQKREMTLINESGVYALIFGSSLPDAKNFKHWVTSEVLPKLRKGELIGANQDSYQIEDPAARARRWAEEFEERQKLTIENAKLQSKADAYDATANDSGTMAIGELAKYIEQKLNAKGYKIHIGRNNFFKYLRSKGYLIKHGSEYNLPTSSAMRLGLFKVVQRPIKKAGWIDTFKSITRATPKAKIYFLNKAEEIVEMN